MQNFKHFLKEGLQPVTAFKIVPKIFIESDDELFNGEDHEISKSDLERRFPATVEEFNTVKNNFKRAFSLKRTHNYEDDDILTSLGADGPVYELEMSFPLVQSVDCLKLRNGFIQQLRAEFGSDIKMEVNSFVWINLPFKGIVVDNVDDVFIEASSPTSLTNIHKMIPTIINEKKSQYSNIRVLADGFSEIVFTAGTIPYIQSNVLGILLIKGEFSIHSNFAITKNELWFEIISNHLKGERDMLDCKAELIEKGFSQYAKL